MLTDRQHEVLLFIKKHIKTVGIPPTVREMKLHFHWGSSNSPRSALKALEKKGAVKLIPRIARGIVILEKYNGDI